MNRARGRVALAGAASLALCAWQGRAAAAGFATQQFGGEHGNVVETNPTALYYNPGAIGFSGDTNIGMYGSLALHSVTWTHDRALDDLQDPPAAAGADTGKANLLNVFGGASIAGTTHIGNLVIGGGFFAPFFGLSHWGENESFTNTAKYPLAKSGVQRWFGIDGKMEVLYFSLGAAYKLGPLSVGATGNFISTTVSSYQARNTAGLGVPDVTNEGRSYFDVQGYSASVGAGAMLEIVPQQAWLGVSYQSQPSMGEQSINGDLFVTPPGQKAQHYDVTFHQSLPDVYRAGLRVHPKAIPWEFRAFGDFTRWSRMTRQCVVEKGNPCDVAADGSQLPNGVVLANIRRNWSDTWGVRVGASYWYKPRVELFVGAGYEIAASPDSTIAPDLPDANNILGALGGRFALTEYLFFMASYTHIQYLNRDVKNESSTLASDPVNGAYGYPTVQGNGGGLYTQWAGVLSGNLEAMF
jgi:long-chain fatty acid transport protein